MNKWTAAADAVEQIFDGATIALAGSGGGLLEADAVLAKLEQRFLETGHPRDLTVVHALGIGDAKGSGLGRFAHAGMVKRVIGGHWSWAPSMQKLAKENAFEAYSFPAGAISTLLREIGAGRPGLVTHVGLRTFVDPRIDGGRINERATEDLVELIELDGREYLRYKPFKVDFAVLRGSSADESGNVTLRREPADLDVYAAALAAHNSGGCVIVQVKEREPSGYVPARLVRIPGILVDTLVETPEQVQCVVADYDPALSGEALCPIGDGFYEVPTGIRRIIAERAATELHEGQSANFGFGIPGGIPALLAEQGRLGTFWGSVEQGIHNGAMLDGPMFGTARNADAILSSVDQFDFYSGGGVDVSFLGMGEMDGEGNINVSKLGATVVGPGGFIDITQGARKIVFCGSFEAKGLEVEQVGTRLNIVSQGSVPKLVERVQHVTFSGEQARLSNQEVLYVTERAVFRLEAGGVRLIEVAEGIDVERDVLARMAFRPLVDEALLARTKPGASPTQEKVA
ncbi:acyl CoA:acetate/3-ketoacid CoA transferase [Paraburkholderia domus]|uniref:acyl CoA:acetate/3-ketoacid CoA transferase n=1 Tax=Paraburkholderia domus TaxID=2793075 RepID=UPI0019140350|nr:CoA-transferase [Paraburkholderia domus]MBK5065977.1 acyl CoA:acetate/3-ketoacid CoA transferase [Burkholderia sp. R-70199]CAE6965265.1 Caffeate CoA-transferase [Paraburkholderia domus]